MQINNFAFFVTTVGPNNESGGGLYSKTILEALSKYYTVKILLLKNHQKINNKKLRWLIALGKSIITGFPPNIIFHSGLLDNEIKNVFQANANLIVIDHLESSLILNSFNVQPVIYVSHNREGSLIKEKLPDILSPLSRILAMWVERYEIKFSNSVKGIISISNQESCWYKLFCDNVGVVYPAFPFHKSIQSSHNFSKNKVKSIGFIGPYFWKPNRDAVSFLVDKVAPYLENDVDFFLAGHGWKEFSLTKKNKHYHLKQQFKLIVMGYVEDINIFWNKIDMLVAPIISGAGVNVKICEALSRGVPVIAFPHAVRGLPENVLASSRLFIVNSALDFAQAIESFNISNIADENFVQFSSAYAEKILNNVIKIAFNK